MPSITIPDQAAWHATRERHVGGSEIASLFYRYRDPSGDEYVLHAYENPPKDATPLGCVNPWRSAMALFNEKAGIVKPADFSSERMDAGRYVEPAIAEWSIHKYGWPLRKVRRYLTHDTVPGWGASLDFEIHGDGVSGVPVDVKNSDRGHFNANWVCEGQEIVAPPLNYILQIQHQIGVSGADHGWLLVCVGGNELRRGRIDRHEPTQQRIAEAVTAFWAGVRSETPPLAVADYPAVAAAYAYGDKQRTVDLSGSDGLAETIDAYLVARNDLDTQETLVEHLKGKIAAMMGTATRATCGSRRLSWPVINRAEAMIPARLQEAKTYRGALTITGDK